MRSAAPTIATNRDTIHSDAGQSKAPTSHTVDGAMSYRDGGANSTFSSPQQSQESLTTTFTTLQSTAPSAMLGHNQQNTQTPPTTGHNQAYVTQAQNSNHPVTYNQAIANNLLTDNASLLTLASSSKRQRRRSLDTNASVRAIAPSSLFGNSRESLPLSVLSSNMDSASGIFPVPSRPAVALASAERASVYSSSGVAPVVTSERNSYYAGKPDGASIRSGLFGHGKTDSISGSITGYTQSPLAGQKEASLHGRSSRRNSDCQEHDEETDEKIPSTYELTQAKDHKQEQKCQRKDN
jgi:hypothetical protein